MMNLKPTFVLVLATLAATPALAVDHVCEAQLFDRTATLWLQDEQPVQYQWHNRDPLSASMRGNVISIAATPTATFSNVVIGRTSAGQKAIQGDFEFDGNGQAGVFFVCTER